MEDDVYREKYFALSHESIELDRRIAELTKANQNAEARVKDLQQRNEDLQRQNGELQECKKGLQDLNEAFRVRINALESNLPRKDLEFVDTAQLQYPSVEDLQKYSSPTLTSPLLHPPTPRSSDLESDKPPLRKRKLNTALPGAPSPRPSKLAKVSETSSQVITRSVPDIDVQASMFPNASSTPRIDACPKSTYKPHALQHASTRNRAIDGSKAILMSQFTFWKFLNDAPSVAIDPTPSFSKFTRSFLMSEIGGGKNCIGELAVAGKPLYPNPEVYPQTPMEVGQPGLWIPDKEFGKWEGPLFIRDPAPRMRNPPPRQWMYAGQYKSAHVGHSPAEEFTMLCSKVKVKWVNMILTARGGRFARKRARISLRKRGMEVCSGNVRSELSKTEKNFDSFGLAEADIMQALDRGEEYLDVFRLECVSYDHSFAKDLSLKYQVEKRQQAEKAERNGRSGTVKESRELKSCLKGMKPGEADCALVRSTRTQGPQWPVVLEDDLESDEYCVSDGGGGDSSD